MNSKIFTFLLLIFTVIFNNSCSNGDEVEPTSDNNSSPNPVHVSNKILKFIKNYDGITHYFQSSNGKIVLWNTNYNTNYNASVHSISYNSMGKIDKISISNSSVTEVLFKYSNNMLSEILYVYKNTTGNIYAYRSYSILYNNSKIYRIIRTDYSFPQSYIDDNLNNCKILELQFSNENVIKTAYTYGQFSRSTGVINEDSSAHITKFYTYNNSIMNPYSTLSVEFQLYLVSIEMESSNLFYADSLSKNAKNNLTTYTYQSLFSNYNFNYQTDANLNGLPNKIDSNNGNFGSKATFEYDSY
ncbi:hypothetical protein ACFQO9_12010 [Chryseobacterium zhengzhouense]|uniref:YD repeat-containing protein n=1 Tax=Chryseobacterium zhengzhouense TaxID=1636086 RepID=A0ABW2M1N5_9FLAO